MKDMLTKEQFMERAIEAHILSCPYMTAQIGEPIDPVTPKRVAKCGANRLYCTEVGCWYIREFKDQLNKLLTSAVE